MAEWWFRREHKKLKLKYKLYVKQQGRCAYCGELMDTGDATMDRVLPRAMGGSYSQDNVVLAHFRCNLAKGDTLTRATLSKVRGYPWLNFQRLEQCVQDTAPIVEAK